MRFPDKKRKKIKKKKILLWCGGGIFLLAVIGWLALSWTLEAAQQDYINETGDKYVLNMSHFYGDNYQADLVDCTLSAPSGVSLKSDSGEVNYSEVKDPTSIYCMPGNTLYLDSWIPETKCTFFENFLGGRTVTVGDITYYNSKTYISSAYFERTYYLVRDKDAAEEFPISKEALLKDKDAGWGLAEYVQGLLKDSDIYKGLVSNEAGKSIQMSIADDGTGIFKSEVADISPSYNMYVLYRGWINDFMSQNHFSQYSSNNGILLKDFETDQQVVSVVRVSLKMVRWYHNIGGNGYWCAAIMPIISTSNYTVQMKKSAEPPVVMRDAETACTVWDGTDNTVNQVFLDGSVILDYDTKKYENFEIYYYLANDNYSEKELEDLNRWEKASDGTSLELGGKTYLYVKLEPSPEKGSSFDFAYKQGGQIATYQFEYNISKPEGKISLIVGDGSTSVDKGDKVSFSNSNENAKIFYTLDDTIYPQFTVFKGDEDVTLRQLENEAGGESPVYLTDLSDEYNFLGVNGFWYSCDKAVKLDDGTPLTVGKEIYDTRRLTVRALLVEQGCELGNVILLSLPISLKTTVETPVPDRQTTEDVPTEIKMGDTIYFSSSTYGSEIYYTTNGNAPLVSTQIQSDGTKITVPGNNSTIKYEADSGVLITEENATYGANISFLVKAVHYENGVQTMRDSEVARYIYYVGEQTPIEAVTAMPATDDANPTTISAGSTILLNCGTPDTTIYYTTDGTEPVRNEDGSLEGSTMKYNAATGIVVPAQQESMFTVTAIAYADNLATSDMARFVYQYPPAVSSPYATPGSGSVVENTAITLKSSTEGAVIYYEVAYDGKTAETPTENSNVYSEENPITITRTTNIKAIAVKDGMVSAVNEFNYTVSNKLAVPTASVQSGAVIAGGTSITLTAESGATIYYTTDGSNPTDAENTNVNIGNTVFMDGTAGSVITIRTYASRTGYTNSDIANYSYTISNYENAIFANKETGSVVKNGEIVTLNTDVTGAVIYYTLDGSMPTINSAQGNVVTISGSSGSTVILKAIAVVPGVGRTAASANFTYTITEKLKAPQSNIPSGAIFTEEDQVVLTAEEGSIYYTTDGTTPTKSSNVFQDYITITRGVTIKAIAISEDADDSDVSTYVYQFADQVAAPVASHESGQLEMGEEVTLSCGTSDAVIYYTVNGTDPDTDNLGDLQTYTGPITVNRAMTLKAVAVKSGMRDSQVLTVGYTVKEPIVVEDETETDSENISGVGSGGRLQSRRSYAEGGKGPSFTDILLKNAVYGVIAAADFEVIPDETELVVNKIQAGTSAENMVRQSLGEYYSIVSGYDVKLTVNGEEVQPDGEMELGLPIPTEYENSLIYIVYVADDGTVEVQETRRGGDVAYAKVTHFSQYVIAAPVMGEQNQGAAWIWILVGVGSVIVAAAAVILIVRWKLKYYDR